MPRRRVPPKYSHHKATGQAFVVIDGEWTYLGKYKSRASYEAYEAIIKRWRITHPDEPVQPVAVPQYAVLRTVAELVAWFLASTETRSSARVLANYRDALRPLLLLHGRTAIELFGPRALKEVRQAMIAGYEDEDAPNGRREPLSRRVANRRITAIRTAFRRAEEDELIPGGTYHRLATVRGLAKGEHGARERSPVPPAPEALIEPAIAQLSPTLQAVVRVQLLTGARPGELFRLRVKDLSRQSRIDLAPGYQIPADGLWVYQPQQHKQNHRDQHRVILFGPQAQAVLQPLLVDRQPDEYVFSPVHALAQRSQRLRSKRKSKVQPSQQNRRVPYRKRPPRERYSRESYRWAIQRACERAFPPPDGLDPEQLKAWKKAHRWTPYQLRHNAATRMAQQWGWDVARILLGHRRLDTTRIYALDDLQKAVAAAREAG